MKISARTDIGKVRSSNQDSYAAGELTSDIAWAVVCDGMGGATGGNIASEAAVKIISEKIKTGFHDGMNDNSIKRLLVSSIEAANASVYAMSRDNEALTGMGTTAVVAIANPDTLFLAHVGDSRIYIINSENITQLTTDHSIVQMMVDNGEISPEEAKDHPKKNVITRALGVEDSVRIDYAQENVNKDDIVILCSDGLTNFVDDDVIYKVCKESGKYEIADKLVELANENGGGDNVTVVSVTV
jgi:serine/threonine protein phosphatase PrpC